MLQCDIFHQVFPLIDRQSFLPCARHLNASVVGLLYWQECPPGSPDFRALQCVNLHGRRLSIGSRSFGPTQWLPKYAGSK